MNPMDIENFAALQNKLSEKLEIPPDGEGRKLQKGDNVFTIDVQYKGENGFVAVDFLRWEEGHQETFGLHEFVIEPYVPGFFAFREGPLLMRAIERVKEFTGISPQLVIIDGHGLAHPRKFGVACWLGLEMNIPTLGCAKETLVQYEGDLEEEVGSTLPVFVDGEVVGKVLRTAVGVKPVFVSPGHLISMEESVNVVLSLSTGYRIIEPIRRADQAARAYAKGQHNIKITYLD